jgi:hypothetical protein
MSNGVVAHDILRIEIVSNASFHRENERSTRL